MKKTIIGCMFTVVLTGTSMSFTEGDQHQQHLNASHHVVTETEQNQMIEGTIRKVDPETGKITLHHGAVASMNMSMPMTMVYAVKDRAWLTMVKAGDDVLFKMQKVNGVLTIVALQPRS